MRSRLPRSLLLGSVLLGVVLLTALVPASSGAVDQRIANPGDETGRLVLLLDSSGSMSREAAGGGTKIEAAKSALADVVEQLPDSAQVGIRVFGAKVLMRTDPGACTDTQNVVPVGPLDRARLTSAVQRYEPYGETPIGNALKGAAKDLGAARAGERRTIVLLSDGEPTCAPDPCVVARQLRNQGIDLRINVVGLDVSGKARRILQCVARAGGGHYFDASSAAELTENLVQVSVRALRLFSLAGEPVLGGTSTAEPTEIGAGDYVDESLPEKAPKFYLVDVPEGGSVSASAVARPGEADTVLDVLSVTLLTPDGTRCEGEASTGLNALLLQSIVGAAAYYTPLDGSSGADACSEARQMLVQVDFNGPPTPFGLQVRTYPEATNVAELPPPVDYSTRNSWERPVALQRTGTPVIGGATFESAPELAPGTTYSDTLRPREQLIYKVKVGFGQSPRMTARIETDVVAARLQSMLGVQALARTFNTLGTELNIAFNSATGVSPAARYNGERPVTLTQAHPPVRYRNAESLDSRIKQNSLAGYYYFTVEMGRDNDRAAEQFAAPVRLAVAVDGQEVGVPEYAGEIQGEERPSSSPEAQSGPELGDDESSDSGFVMPWTTLAIVGGAVLVVLALVAGFVLGRRRRS